MSSSFIALPPESVSLKEIVASLMLTSAAVHNAKTVADGLIDYEGNKPTVTPARSKLLSALHLLQLSTLRADGLLHTYQNRQNVANWILGPYLKRKQDELSEMSALTIELKQILLNYAAGNEIADVELRNLRSKLDEFKLFGE